jgi:hypothetical protein
MRLLLFLCSWYPTATLMASGKVSQVQLSMELQPQLVVSHSIHKLSLLQNVQQHVRGVGNTKKWPHNRESFIQHHGFLGDG